MGNPVQRALQSAVPTLPLRAPALTDDDLKNPQAINAALNDLTQMVNYLLGHAGPVKIVSSYDFNGNPVKNVGAPKDPADVVSQFFADKYYGAQALLPHFEALGNSVFKTYRQLNNTKQFERFSTFLNGILNTAPTANTANVTATAPSGGTVAVTVSSGLHQRVDGSQVPFLSRTDTFSLPNAFAYTSATRTSNIVTVITPSPSGVVLNESISLGGASDPTFNGYFVVNKIDSSTQFEYLQAGPNASTSGGGYTPVNIYYYTISRGQNSLGLVAATGADSWSNRTAASFDGTTIIAVVALDVNGMEVLNSAAGATSPQANANVPVVRRL